MEDLQKRAEKLCTEITQATDKLDIIQKKNELTELAEQTSRPGFWSDNTKAQAITKQQSKLEVQVKPWLDLIGSIEEAIELIKMGDDSMRSDLEKQIDELEKKFTDLKEDLKFQGQYDDHDAVLNIYAGAGGTDAQDWAQMLERMYLRWAEKEGLKTKIIDESAGEEAGIKSATLEVTGDQFTYGKLFGEHGVHRLVRLSPFNSSHTRETSFAKVEVLPLIDRPEELQIDDKDLKIDVYRAGGHGGQSVNTTDSAVRVTHIPTGIAVAIQNERSQLQNRETAMAILRSKLVALQMEQHVGTLAELKGPSKQNEFGSQDRNYVLHPYKQVKDLRTGYETSDPESILNGNLDPIITAWLEKH